MQTPDRNIEPDATLLSLPWLVNGTLAGEEAAAARTAIGTDLEARRQHRELQALAAMVGDAPLLDANAVLGFERLRRAIDGASGHVLDRNWARPTRVVPIPPARGLKRTLALAAGVLLALVATESAREPGFAPAYTALTRPATDAATLRVVFAATLDEAAIDARLAALGARRVGPVGAQNTVTVATAPEARTAVATALARDPDVRLVAGGGVP